MGYGTKVEKVSGKANATIANLGAVIQLRYPINSLPKGGYRLANLPLSSEPIVGTGVLGCSHRAIHWPVMALALSNLTMSH